MSPSSVSIVINCFSLQATYWKMGTSTKKDIFKKLRALLTLLLIAVKMSRSSFRKRSLSAMEEVCLTYKKKKKKKLQEQTKMLSVLPPGDEILGKCFLASVLF
jgi:hypothetical protein